jgi:uncharacterized protein YbbC (DUF1343 family)
MEACAENNIQLILDRPNPEVFVDGPTLEKEFTSFVGMHPIVLHGMTIGYSQMINGEHWLKDGISCNN